MQRTTISFVVLSEDPIPDGMELETILIECDRGGYVLVAGGWKTERLNEAEMAEALTAAGSDPDFFQIIL